MTNEQRDRVIECAMTWLRTPYHHKAAAKGAGVDCVHLVMMAYAEAGVIEAFDTGDYPPDWMLHREDERILSWLDANCVRTSDPQPADIAAWRFGRAFSHLAIVVDSRPVFIHAYRPYGEVVLSDVMDVDLSARPILYFSLRD